jgi:triacylglycerol lipase
VIKGILILMAICSIAPERCVADEHVILLHGLCRTKRSMQAIEAALARDGYQVSNVDYPSRSSGIAQLSERTVGDAIAACRERGASRIHFVTHSMGGILVRDFLSRHSIPDLGRVVMLSPPNGGSEVVDVLGRCWMFKVINGPAGTELGTDSCSAPCKLGAVSFPLGVIAGDRSINWINSLFIRGTDDGKVSIERTKVAGMRDHVVVHATHPFIPRNRVAIDQIIKFLRDGEFNH